MKPQCGSALIMVLCICAVLMIATTSSWYTACLLHDASCVHQHTFQRTQSVNGLLVYATQSAKQMIEKIYPATQPTVLYDGPWPCGDRMCYTGYAVSYQENNRLKVCATLKKTGKPVAMATAVLLLKRITPCSESVALLNQPSPHVDVGSTWCFLVEQWGSHEIDVCC